MEHAYLFRFGFCTPEQWESNEAHGWEDEESAAVLVTAENQAQAMAWGTEVAECAVAWLFQSAGHQGHPSWRQSGFSHWIEEDQNVARDILEVGNTPTVRPGELPDFETWFRGGMDAGRS